MNFNRTPKISFQYVLSLLFESSFKTSYQGFALCLLDDLANIIPDINCNTDYSPYFLFLKASFNIFRIVSLHFCSFEKKIL